MLTRHRCAVPYGLSPKISVKAEMERGKMLQKLKLQLVLINVISLTVVLIAIFIYMYFSLDSQLKNQEGGTLERLAVGGAVERNEIPEYISDGEDAPAPAINASMELVASVFFVKVDFKGNITSLSLNPIQDKTTILNLIQKVDDMSKKRGELDFFDLTLSFITKDRLDGKLYVFMECSDRKATTLNYIYTALTALAGSVICVFFISMFLAEKAIKPIKDSMERQKKFIADASHELRTPISVIRSNAEMIMDEPELTVGENMKWLEYISSEAKRMTAMTEDLLLLSHADAKKEIAKEEVDLSKLVYDTYDSFKLLFEERNLTQGAADITENISIYANEFRIKQLVTIFLDNAMKYTKEGGISVKLEKDENFAYIKITDTGSGIPPDMIDKIFERFFRVDKARAKATGGAGLGLSIAKVIADEHGGEISVESEVDKGSVFCVKLPLLKS